MDRNPDPTPTAEQIAEIALARDLRVATAESLTGGRLAASLARANDAGTWFRGGVVAYAAEVKHDVLAVRPGPVVSETAVREMAEGVADLLGADAAVAVSGAAGPSPLEGQPPGTVWFGVHVGDTTVAELHHLDGDPDDVCAQTCAVALDLLLAHLTDAGADPTTDG